MAAAKAQIGLHQFLPDEILRAHGESSEQLHVYPIGRDVSVTSMGDDVPVDLDLVQIQT